MLLYVFLAPKYSFYLPLNGLSRPFVEYVLWSENVTKDSSTKWPCARWTDEPRLCATAKTSAVVATDSYKAFAGAKAIYGVDVDFFLHQPTANIWITKCIDICRFRVRLLPTWLRLGWMLYMVGLTHDAWRTSCGLARHVGRPRGFCYCFDMPSIAQPNPAIVLVTDLAVSRGT